MAKKFKFNQSVVPNVVSMYSIVRHYLTNLQSSIIAFRKFKLYLIALTINV
jgi:hypothetical protein